MTIARNMAERVLAVTYADLPAEALQWAKIAILDTLAVTIAGAHQPCTLIAAQVPGIADLDGQALVIGHGRRTSILDAAFINGIASHALDYDDVNNQIGGHPSVPLVPALFAFGDAVLTPGEAAISAYVAGFELETQIGLCVNYHHYNKGWHPTATLGIFGTVALGSRLMSLGVDETAQALAMAASLAGGLKANFGTMTKPLHIGQSLRNGVMAVLMAKNGFTASEDAFEHKQGFFEVFNGKERYNIERVFSNWGTPWNVTNPGPSVKVYPCCGSTHGAIECTLAIRSQGSPNPKEVRTIEILTDPKRLPHTDNVNPTSGLSAKFSVQYVVARALLDGRVGLSDFENSAFDEPLVRELMAKVMLGIHADMQDPEIDTYGAEVTITMNDGQKFTHRSNDIVLRGPSRPMDKTELFTKFKDCTQRMLPSETYLQLYEKLCNFETLSSMRSITDLLAAIDPVRYNSE